MNRRELDFGTFDEVAADVRQLHDNGYDKVGQWDLAQICGHLTIAIEQSLSGFSFTVPWWVRVIMAPWIKRKLFRTGKIKPGLPAPADMIRPPGGDEAHAVDQLMQMLVRVDQQPGGFQIHPVFGPLSDEQWRRFHLIHMAHHLSFLVPR